MSGKRQGDDSRASPAASWLTRDFRLLRVMGLDNRASPWDHPACSWLLALFLPSDLPLVSQVDLCPGQESQWPCHIEYLSLLGRPVCWWK